MSTLIIVLPLHSLGNNPIKLAPLLKRQDEEIYTNFVGMAYLLQGTTYHAYALVGPVKFEDIETVETSDR